MSSSAWASPQIDWAAEQCSRARGSTSYPAAVAPPYPAVVAPPSLSPSGQIHGGTRQSLQADNMFHADASKAPQMGMVPNSSFSRSSGVSIGPASARNAQAPGWADGAIHSSRLLQSPQFLSSSTAILYFPPPDSNLPEGSTTQQSHLNVLQIPPAPPPTPRTASPPSSTQYWTSP